MSNTMNEKQNILAHNLRTLRKANKMSQEELAKKLGIKRSSIAAYESKNVEPRLRIILEIAKLFDINVKNLIESKINSHGDYPTFEEATIASEVAPKSFELSQNDDVNVFINKSVKIRKILEGFKAFYTFKKNAIVIDSPEKEKLTFDIDNFIQLMEHLLNYNESVIKAISSAKTSEA